MDARSAELVITTLILRKLVVGRLILILSFLYGAATRYQLRKLDRMPNIPRAVMEARPTVDPSVHIDHLVEAQPTMSPDVEDELDVEGELSI
jgi:hypothetical protein